MTTSLSLPSLSELLNLTVFNFSRGLIFSYKYSTSNRHSNAYNNNGFSNVCPKSNNLAINQDYDPKTHVLGLLSEIQYDRSPHNINKIVSLCSKSRLFDTGFGLHSVVVKVGLLSNVYVCSGLVDLYGKCRRIGCAYQVFDEMPVRNVVTWNSLISGCLMVEMAECGIELFVGMLREGIVITAFSVSFVLVGCTRLDDGGDVGVQLHGLCLKNGVSSNVVVGTGLIDMYAKCWGLEEARRVFDGMQERNGVTWTTMIAAYSQDGLPYEAMNMFREMKRLGKRPNLVTFNNLLSSFCGKIHLDHCKQIHGHIIREGLESSEYIQTSLVSVYAECKCRLDDFERLCFCIEKWDQVSWSAIIAGFSHLEHNEKAFECFLNMMRSGVGCNCTTLSSILRTIGMVSRLEYGKQVHALAFKIGYGINLHVQNGLVSMYGRCGLINDAKNVFLRMKERDLISWNSLIAGFCHHGYGVKVINLFEEMRRTNIQPDQNTFVSVISACSHSGLVKDGLKYYYVMRKLYPGNPISMDLYTSMIDMFGRAGYIYEAENFIRSMPIVPGPSIYRSLLSACKLYENLEVGKWASQRLLEQYPKEFSTCVLLSNSLVTRGCWDEAEGVWKLMDHRKAEKRAGYSWVE